MQFIANFFQRHREKAILGLLIILSLTLFLLPETVQFRFARSTLNTLLLPVSRSVDFVDNYFSMQDENRRLKRRFFLYCRLPVKGYVHSGKHARKRCAMQ